MKLQQRIANCRPEQCVLPGIQNFQKRKRDTWRQDFMKRMLGMTFKRIYSSHEIVLFLETPIQDKRKHLDFEILGVKEGS